MVGHVLSQPPKFARREVKNDVEFTGPIPVKCGRCVLNGDVTNLWQGDVGRIVEVLILDQFDESLGSPVC
ncbi:MAG: hypothetical protein Ct9H300mP8_00560 [Gammaproteobacteria bacterium]|nr:MAG: hypothetical protein Ct9H300mP8_00560 [Gammaproteobacteria bacterium]